MLPQRQQLTGWGRTGLPGENAKKTPGWALTEMGRAASVAFLEGWSPLGQRRKTWTLGFSSSPLSRS